MQFTIKTGFKILIWLVIIILLITGGYLYWRYEIVHPSTEDAYVKANIIEMAAQITGPVDAINTQNHDFVKQGQVLFTIDPRPFEIAFNQAKANLDNVTQQIKALEDTVATARAVVTEREAQFIATRKNTHRILTLVKKGVYPLARGDDAKSSFDVAKAVLVATQSQLQEAKQKLGKSGDENAQIRAAKADLAQATLNLQHTRIYAPAAGQIINFDLRVGSIVTAEQPLFALIENNRWWVDANFKETDLGRIKLGQKADITIDMYPEHKFIGTVVNISGGSGAAFSLLPPEDATGNWIKVTQRFPVKIKVLNLDPKHPLRVGASSKIIINTSNR